MRARWRRDALRMGLPIVTLAGPVLRLAHGGQPADGGGLTEGIAATLEDYVGVAVALGADPARHARLRAALAGGEAWRRVIGDGAAFAARMEAAYESVLLTEG